MKKYQREANELALKMQDRSKGMYITREWIFKFRTVRGGFNRKQLAAIGVSWPPAHGWVSRVEGKWIDDAHADAYIRHSGRDLDGNIPGRKIEVPIKYSDKWLDRLRDEFGTLPITEPSKAVETKPNQPELDWPELELTNLDRLAFLLSEVEQQPPSQPETAPPPWA